MKIAVKVNDRDGTHTVIDDSRALIEHDVDTLKSATI